MRSWILSGSIAAVFAMGCAGGRVNVSGTVAYEDGALLEDGTIFGEMEGEGAKEMAQAAVKGGKFTFSSIPAGKYKIMVQCQALGDAEIAEGKPPLIEGKYGSYTSSGLTLDTSAGASGVKFTVGKKPTRKK